MDSNRANLDYTFRSPVPTISLGGFRPQEYQVERYRRLKVQKHRAATFESALTDLAKKLTQSPTKESTHVTMPAAVIPLDLGNVQMRFKWKNELHQILYGKPITRKKPKRQRRKRASIDCSMASMGVASMGSSGYLGGSFDMTRTASSAAYNTWRFLTSPRHVTSPVHKTNPFTSPVHTTNTFSFTQTSMPDLNPINATESMTPTIMTKYKGEKQDLKKHGYGEATYSNGDMYKGQWQEGKKGGKGKYNYKKMKVKFTGSYYENLMDKKGVLKFADGIEIHTKWDDGKMTTNDIKMTFPNDYYFTGGLHEEVRYGPGKLCLPNGVECSAVWVNDMREGYGLINYQDDGFYEGNFNQDQATGQGILILTNAMTSSFGASRDAKRFNLIGEVDKSFVFYKQYKFGTNDIAYVSKPKTFLKEFFPNTWKTFESGYFKWGALHGVGVAIYGCFAKYEGSFRDGLRHGYGRMQYEEHANGCENIDEYQGVYVGQWRDDIRHGKGTMTWHNGMKYVGQFRNGKRDNVKGKMYFNVGNETYNGQWTNNMMDGPCKVKLSDGRRYHGKFVNGKVAAVGAVVYPDGKKYEGNMSDYIPNGQGKMTYANGSWFDGEWEGGNKVEKGGKASGKDLPKDDVVAKPVDSVAGAKSSFVMGLLGKLKL